MREGIVPGMVYDSNGIIGITDEQFLSKIYMVFYCVKTTILETAVLNIGLNGTIN